MKIDFKRFFARCYRRVTKSKNVLLSILAVVAFILFVQIVLWLSAIMKTKSFQEFRYPLYQDIYQLIDLHPTGTVERLNPGSFDILLDEVEKTKDLYFLYLIKTRHTSVDQRNLLRRTWANDNCTKRMGVVSKHVFLLGNLKTDTENDRKIMRAIRKEAQNYKDIVVMDFVENYYNNTFKVVSGIDYSLKYFPLAKYIVIVDDDYFVHPGNLVKHLKSVHPKRYPRYLAGSVWFKSRPYRSIINKWSVDFDDYPFNMYPDYPAGGNIILSMELAEKILIAFQYTKYLPFDDVLIGIILYKLSIVPRHVEEICKTSYECEQLPEPNVISLHSVNDAEVIKREWKRHSLDAFCKI